MSQSEAALTAVRLARMKAMIKSLEAACSQSAEQRALLLKLKKEMDIAHAALKIVKS